MTNVSEEINNLRIFIQLCKFGLKKDQIFCKYLINCVAILTWHICHVKILDDGQFPNEMKANINIVTVV